MSQSTQPLVSIITVVFNAEKTLEKSIRSVIGQSYDNIEYIIIDGQSSDRTIDIIRNYNENINYWISEADNGIYDAMNKAIGLAKGEWLYFLGADDYLIDNTVISKVFESDNSDFSLVIGNVVEDSGKIFTSTINWKTNLFNSVHHQAAFYRKNLFNEFRYNPKFKVIADYELNLRVLNKKLCFKYINQNIAHFSTSGLSRNSSEYINLFDYFKIRSNYIGPIKNIIFSISFLLNVIRRNIGLVSNNKFKN